MTSDTDEKENKKSEKKYLQKASVGMALLDALPVIFFSLSVIFLSRIYKAPLFVVGAVICTIAGLGKVLWKLIMAVSGRSLLILTKYFRWEMMGGFLLMLLSVILGWNSQSGALIWKNVSQFPVNVCLAIGFAGMVAMGVLGSCMDSSSAKANWIEEGVNTVGQLSILLGVIIIWCGAQSYAPAKSEIPETENVQVKTVEKGLTFDGPGSDTAFIFYPGAQVTYQAYAPLMYKIAEGGVDCFLVEMPYNMGLFDVNRADEMMAAYDYQHWYIGGHSLGGAMASSYAAKNPEKLDGLVMLAAYPTKPLDDRLKVLTVYGSCDEVLNRDKLAKGETYMPQSAKTWVIEGGNHAQFGDYGCQKGDGNAAISKEEQWQMTAYYILEMIRDQTD